MWCGDERMAISLIDKRGWLVPRTGLNGNTSYHGPDKMVKHKQIVSSRLKTSVCVCVCAFPTCHAWDIVIIPSRFINLTLFLFIAASDII